MRFFAYVILAGVMLCSGVPSLQATTQMLNNEDLLSKLPLEISWRILSFVDSPEEVLGRCGRLSKTWNQQVEAYYAAGVNRLSPLGARYRMRTYPGGWSKKYENIKLRPLWEEIWGSEVEFGDPKACQNKEKVQTLLTHPEVQANPLALTVGPPFFPMLFLTSAGLDLCFESDVFSVRDIWVLIDRASRSKNFIENFVTSFLDWLPRGKLAELEALADNQEGFKATKDRLQKIQALLIENKKYYKAIRLASELFSDSPHKKWVERYFLVDGKKNLLTLSKVGVTDAQKTFLLENRDFIFKKMPTELAFFRRTAEECVFGEPSKPQSSYQRALIADIGALIESYLKVPVRHTKANAALKDLENLLKIDQLKRGSLFPSPEFLEKFWSSKVSQAECQTLGDLTGTLIYYLVISGVGGFYDKDGLGLESGNLVTSSLRKAVLKGIGENLSYIKQKIKSFQNDFQNDEEKIKNIQDELAPWNFLLKGLREVKLSLQEEWITSRSLLVSCNLCAEWEQHLISCYCSLLKAGKKEKALDFLSFDPNGLMANALLDFGKKEDPDDTPERRKWKETARQQAEDYLKKMEKKHLAENSLKRKNALSSFSGRDYEEREVREEIETRGRIPSAFPRLLNADDEALFGIPPFGSFW